MLPVLRHVGELLAQGLQARRRLRRFGFPDHPPDFVQRRLAEGVGVKRRHARQQLVEQHAQRIDVRPRINVQAAQGRLFRAHVGRRADHVLEAGEERLLRQLLPQRLGHAEINHLGHRLAVMQRHQHVARLDVAVNDALLMRVLHRLADLHEKLQPLARGKVGSGRSSR